MVPRMRRFFDVRPGEGLRVLLSFLYVAVVVAAFLLARPIRNSLFLEQYGPYALVYVYAAVPLVLSLFVPVYTRVAARLGSRAGNCRHAGVLQRQRRAVLVRLPLSCRREHERGSIGCLCRHVLRLGELFRRDRAGAGLELRQLPLRHAAGHAGCSGSIGAGASLGAIGGGTSGARFWSGRSAARST